MKLYPPDPMDAVRSRLTKAAVRACAFSVLWAGAVGLAALAAGISSRSIALVGFGLDALVDGSASAVLVLRFGRERRSAERIEHAEALALRLVRAALLFAAAYVFVQAIWNLMTRSRPAVGGAGIALSGTSVAVLSNLAWVKLRLARRLDGGALRGDGILSAAGAALAAAALLGLLLAEGFDWWWSDPTAALVIAIALASEGARAGTHAVH